MDTILIDWTVLFTIVNTVILVLLIIFFVKLFKYICIKIKQDKKQNEKE